MRVIRDVKIAARPFVFSTLLLFSLCAPWVWDLLAGRSTLFLRDIGTTHLPARAVFTQIGYARVNPYSSFGQPYIGNPNLLVAYPFPKHPRWLGLHVILHIVVALVGMALFLRALGLSADSALFGGLSFGLSGYVLSASSSLNTLTTIAWIPWVLLAAVSLSRGDRAVVRSIAALPIMLLFSISGEPVLIALTLLVALCITVLTPRALLSFVAVCTAAGLLLLPVHLATWRAAVESSRVVDGYSFERATAASLHPARLAETLLPFFFGNPSRIGPGSFWGYAVSNGVQPYIFSLVIGVMTLLFALLFVIVTRGREARYWVVLFVVSVVCSFGGYLPGAALLYAMLPALHVVRFPIKFFLFTTFALSVLGAHGFEILLGRKGRPSSVAVVVPIAAAFAFLLAAVFAQASLPSLTATIVRLWWNPAWRSAPEIVLAPIVSAIPGRLLAVSALLGVGSWSIARPTPFRKFIIQLLCGAELLASGHSMFPVVNAQVYETRSPLVAVATRIPGRVFERAGKDLDPVRFGLFGSYAANDVTQLAFVQARQAWSSYGVSHGLRYAFDRSPDGSFTWRNQRVEDGIEHASWSRRMKWLRAAGVGSIITSDRLSFPNIHPAVRETSGGIPVRLYAIDDRLPEVRRSRRIWWARSAGEAIAIFESESFDPGEDVVLEGVAPVAIPNGGAGDTRFTRIVRDQPEEMVLVTSGPQTAAVFVARSFTRFVTARVNGRPAVVYPANAHLCGVVVPSGTARVALRFG